MIKSYIHMLVVYVHLLPNNLKLLYPSALSSPSPIPLSPGQYLSSSHYEVGVIPSTRTCNIAL